MYPQIESYGSHGGDTKLEGSLTPACVGATSAPASPAPSPLVRMAPCAWRISRDVPVRNTCEPFRRRCAQRSQRSPVEHILPACTLQRAWDEDPAFRVGLLVLTSTNRFCYLFLYIVLFHEVNGHRLHPTIVQL